MPEVAVTGSPTASNTFWLVLHPENVYPARVNTFVGAVVDAEEDLNKQSDAFPEVLPELPIA